ncbi:endo-1,3(4)-beta-glucanase [Exophiala viscosa]|uniref:Endo-1,3(4)-beta-glucanase n=2 Tax=Exophiala viscosa TaxID=2486360 RepID=A0AAN6E1G5_9EURO|nr:endo-1,3(4)-beta-glucanase [Exophiala viscosa]
MVQLYTTLVVVILLGVSNAQNGTSNSPYQLVKNYTSENFFQSFDFFSGPDPSNSFVTYLDLDTANDAGLAGYISSSALNDSYAVFLGTDFKNVTPDGRPSVRVQGRDWFNHSLIVADIMHMPSGCGTWPAFWLLGQGAPWPRRGEVDIIEGINNNSVNTLALHSDAGVSVANLTSLRHGNHSAMTGTFTSLDCDVGSSNVGCAATGSPESYGADFNAQGGRVVVTEISADVIQIWSFERDNIPQDLSEGLPNPHHEANGSSWGAPEVKFVNNGNDTFDDHFINLQPIFNTAFCGSWVEAFWHTSECSSLAPTCESYVANNPAAFVDAYWAIGGLQVYEPNGNYTSGYSGPELGRLLNHRRHHPRTVKGY